MSVKSPNSPLYVGPHISENLWRHQESSALRQHLSNSALSSGEEYDKNTGVNTSTLPRPGILSENDNTKISSHEKSNNTSNKILLSLKCGPLLNYRRMMNEIWFGSVLIVTNSHDNIEDTVSPSLELEIQNASLHQSHQDDHVTGTMPHTVEEKTNQERIITGAKIYSDQKHIFWTFKLQVPIRNYGLRCQYSIRGLIDSEEGTLEKTSFYIPAISESMRIMFYSCNGFSIGTNVDAFSGACLWNDVLRVHQRTPFHVMIGGGDQIYNDGIRVDGPLRKWADTMDPLKKKDYPFDSDLREKCDSYYVTNYIRWYTTEPFASSNRQIAQINVWDDHDIIDGFGSYDENLMCCPVFKGVGEVANKYYLLFQHHLDPKVSACKIDHQTTLNPERTSLESGQTRKSYLLEEPFESCYITGGKLGPYITEYSRSIFTRLGARVAFLGIDGRTERTLDQVNYHETYERIFKRVHHELLEASLSTSPIRHLIILLGIPIAYPRLTWLENIFASSMMNPVKFLNKKYKLAGGFFNQFDGNVDLLDDLEDHYTATKHKRERAELVRRFQEIAIRFSVRISILGGDVHLAAMGRFYSSPKLGIPISRDHRYMVNIISSAIVNKPPPKAVANLIAWSNKTHHLDTSTDEKMMKFFDKDPGARRKTTRFNFITMPRRNWTMLTENCIPKDFSLGHGNLAPVMNTVISSQKKKQTKNKSHCLWLHSGEIGAGTLHKAANVDQHGRGTDGGLDVCIRVEIDHHDIHGKTELYGMTIPPLDILDAC